MALELVYTSATKGLRAGTSGFCTVAMTRGLPPALVPRLEALGGYRPGPSGDGPVASAFWRIDLAGSIAHVLSVVGPAPPDHTQRTNKIATYLVLGADELVPAGPAWLLGRSGLVRRAWQGDPAWIEAPVRVPASGPVGPRVCSAWQAASGDAGWAGAVASAFLRDQGKPIHVVVPAALDPLPLADEVICLLPDWARWRLTFSTYFLQPVAGVPCALRFCLEGTPAADAARQSKSMVLDLVRGPGTAPDGRHARVARTGVDEEAMAEARAKQAAAAKAAKAAAAKAAVARAKAEEIQVEPAGPEDPQRTASMRRIPMWNDEDKAAPLEEVERRKGLLGAFGMSGGPAMAVLGILVLALVATLLGFFVVPYVATMNRAADEVTGGAAARTGDAVHEPAHAAPAPEANVPPSVPAPVPPAPTPPAPTPPAPTPPAPETVQPSKPATDTLDPMAASTPSTDPTPGGDAATDHPPTGDAPSAQESNPLLNGTLFGAIGYFRQDGPDRRDEVSMSWSAPSGVKEFATAHFRTSPSFDAFGVLATGHELRIDGMEHFVAEASVRGRDVVVRVRGLGDAMPAALADALSSARSANERSPVLARCAVEILDAGGAPVAMVGFSKPAGTPVVVDALRPVVVPAPAGDPLVVQVLSGRDRARTVRAECVVAAGTNEILQATALLRVSALRTVAGDGGISIVVKSDPTAAARRAEVSERMMSLEPDARGPLQRELSELKPDPSKFDLTIRVSLPSGAVLLDAAMKLPEPGGPR